MAGYRSISNDDAIDWLPRPVVLFNSPLFLFFFLFPFLTALQMLKNQEARADPQVPQGAVSIKQLTQVSGFIAG